MKTVKKGIVGILVFTMLFIGYTSAFTYADGPSSWAEDWISEAIEHQLTTEKVLSNYQQPITREEFATLAVNLYHALGGEAPQQQEEDNPFLDTEDPIVLQAYHLGIINGQSATHFAPEAPITRQELSVMLVRTKKALNPDFEAMASRPMFFLDRGEIAPWALEEIHYLFDEGIIDGMEALRIHPRSLATREQGIAFVMRSFKVFDTILRQAEALRVGQGGDAISLDPHQTMDTLSSRVMKQIYETLVIQNEEMEIEAGLAESWRYIDDLTIEFKLKEGVQFHNGEELTARDVEFTLLRALDSPFIGHIVGMIDPDGITVMDDYTIRVATVEPNKALLAHLAHTGTSILNEKAVVEAGDVYGDKPVGTGAFKFDLWNRGDSIELVRFNDYHGEAARMERIVFKAVHYAPMRLDELEKGQLHIAYDILPRDIQRFKDHEEMMLQRSPGLTSAYVGFNVLQEPYNDVRVRQAINYAVDMDRIVAIVYEGTGTPAKGPLSNVVWGANEDLETYDYDVERALALMEEAGYVDGFETTIWVNDNQQRMDMAVLLQQQLKEINIDVDIIVKEWGTYLDGTASGEHDMFVLGWVTATGDPDYGLYSLFHSTTFGAMGNRTFYANDRVDELLDKSRKEADRDIRREYYLEIQEIITEEAPWIFAWINEHLTGIRNDVGGFRQHPTGHHLLSGVHLE
ncbi:MAG: S-layer homology domain-containing protein [Clostridiaceae bacterium]|nr:S-layer homology domain-containing protein [Clostridiaceae bacterium]